MQPLNIAILTISDTRSLENDASGQCLQTRVLEKHQLADRQVCTDNLYEIRARLSQWIADPSVQCIITTGGTGFYPRDITPEAVTPLFDREIPGFGECFRAISMEDIGLATIQSRAIAGLANRTLIFCLPGSPNACKTAWHHIIDSQLNSETKPCNFFCHLEPLT